MADGEDLPGGKGPALRAARPRGRRRWWRWGAGAAGLLAANAAWKVREGLPFALSALDALVLVALAVVLGTYAILARAGREPPSPRPGEPGPEADDR